MDKKGEGAPKMTPIGGDRLTVGGLINVLRRTDHYYSSVLLDLTGAGKYIVEMSGWMRMDCGDDKDCLALTWQVGGNACSVEGLMRAIYWGEMERWFTNDTHVIIIESGGDNYDFVIGPSENDGINITAFGCDLIQALPATGVTDNGENGMVITCDAASGMFITCEGTQDNRKEGGER